ncbi:MAG: acylneuraminate cytidylyltransferase family protein [Fidelibacterota bacterium]|nr:MAG: acylneuraminate cytidylyltransferase family protein [Candidatus Neomarinimicrobiota bacterium]
MMEVLALIPARSGSKSVPDKNIVPVAGRPLLAWTILAAQSARQVQRLVVSTDSGKIADVARKWGAEVPFMRPKELAQDDTPGIDPVLHALQWLQEHETYEPDYLVLLQCTSPLRTGTDIDGAIQLALQHNADAVVSVTVPDQHPYMMKTVREDGGLESFLPHSDEYTRRQDMPVVYALNGALYLARPRFLIKSHSWYGENTFAYTMPPERSLDIDTPWHQYLADLILRNRNPHESPEDRRA